MTGMVNDGATGGWHLDLRCTTCGVEGQYTGFIPTQALDAAKRDGWLLEPENLVAKGLDRSDMCALCVKVCAA